MILKKEVPTGAAGAFTLLGTLALQICEALRVRRLACLGVLPTPVFVGAEMGHLCSVTAERLGQSLSVVSLLG